MESRTGMSQYLDAFEELVVGLQTLGEVVDEAIQLKKNTTMEKTFQANGNAGKCIGGRANDRKRNAPRKNRGAFKGKCFGCNQVGHMKRDFPSQRGDNGN
ncbi:unnamed protein product [Peronospora belbahrii]|uniref:CCHC-type domain-containing protein n=1 Tax=Peronospora belbahrii TaxID=622444 RepID=A0AAU9LEI7_9STRA|nr:unnamed protein product [Peronospora belbahrii]